MRRLKKSLILLSLIGMLCFPKQNLQAQAVDLDQDQTHDLVERLKDCEKAELDLTSTSQALTQCQNDILKSTPSFWQKPGFVIGGFAVTFTVATIFGLTKCFGVCK